MKECNKCGYCGLDGETQCPNDESKLRISLPGDLTIADRYEVLRRLGRGAMGQVYLARDKKLGTREVAIKTVRQDILSSVDMAEGEALARFEREAISAGSIRHPNCVNVTDYGETVDGIFYLVMEYVEGETLHRLLRREGTLPLKRAINILRQIADGIEAAHEKSILHRDLKPANIFIMNSRRDKDGIVKIGDFGLAKIGNQTVSDASSMATPSSRGIIGTPEYMSPEQMQPEVGVDERADLYSLGTIAYLILAGRTPFTGDLMELVMQKVVHEPPSITSFRDDIPENVAEIIMLAIAREPDARPTGVGEWIDQLESAAESVGKQVEGEVSRLVVLAPVGSEVYLDDERQGNVGKSGRIVVGTVPTGQHLLRVTREGSKDDERVIEIREGGEDQVINAQLRSINTGGALTGSQGASSNAPSSILPGIVACRFCGSRFADGVQYCGRCGNRDFSVVKQGDSGAHGVCPRCSSHLYSDSKFCGKCGLVLGNTAGQRVAQVNQEPIKKYCGKCGERYDKKVKFCGVCGNTF